MRYLCYKEYTKSMKTTLSFALASVAAVAFILAMSPAALADSDGTKTYKHHWSISIGDAVGTLEITENTDMAALKEQAIYSEEVTIGYENVVKARLAQAENNSGQYFLIWKIVTENEDSTYTLNAVDAGSGELLTSVAKEGGGCGFKKSNTTETSGQA